MWWGSFEAETARHTIINLDAPKITLAACLKLATIGNVNLSAESTEHATLRVCDYDF